MESKTKADKRKRGQLRLKNYALCPLFLGNDRPLAALGGLAVRRERIMKGYGPSDGMASARDVCPSVVSTLLRSPTVMDSVESPRIPFELFVRRFTKVPRIIIYDNACKLHLYALKREPVRFSKTKFLVDRLHYRLGYMYIYASLYAPQNLLITLFYIFAAFRAVESRLLPQTGPTPTVPQMLLVPVKSHGELKHSLASGFGSKSRPSRTKS